jgi:mannan endo-1,4-beta-mannosidase
MYFLNSKGIADHCKVLLQAWIEEMAAYVKALDSKHLVTVGTEGFYGPGRTERLDVNPGDWAASLCSDFIQNSAVKHIDFASVHAYPDIWSVLFNFFTGCKCNGTLYHVTDDFHFSRLPKASVGEKIKYLSNWVDSHLNDSEYILRKPVLFSEVGFLHHAEANSTVDGDTLLKVVYDKIYSSTKKLQAGSGALIWQLMVEGMQMYHDDFSMVARDRPSTYKLIKGQSCRLQRLHAEEGDPGWLCSLPP